MSLFMKESVVYIECSEISLYKHKFIQVTVVLEGHQSICSKVAKALSGI